MWKVAQFSPALLNDKLVQREEMTLNIQKLQKTITLSTQNILGERRFLQDGNTSETSEVDTNTPILTSSTLTCSHSVLLGESTVEDLSHFSLVFNSYSKTMADSLFQITEDQSESYDVPLCELVDIQLLKSQPQGTDSTKITIPNLALDEEEQKITLCFETNESIITGTVFKVYSQTSKSWIEDTASSIDEGLSTETKFCRKVTQTGVYGLFNAIDTKPERLYKGFILYIIIVIDVFLIIGIALGNKMDAQA